MATATSGARPAAGRRAAALVALGAPVVAVALGVVVLWQRPGLLLAVVGLVVAGCVCLWFAVTRRGLVRLVGAVGGCLALVGLVLVGLHNLGLVAAVLVLVALFGVAARYALSRDARTGAAAGSPDRVVAAAQRGVVIINPKSGGGKAAQCDLVGEAARRHVQPVVLAPGDDLLGLARQAIADGADVIGMAGGDGSQALVATVAAAHDISLVCIPAGTRNHFALDLGLDRDDVVGALDAFTDGVERHIDLASVNDRIIVNNASLGVYARVVQSDAYRDAKRETWTRMLPDLLGPDAPPPDLEFEGPDAGRYADAPLILVSNNPYQLTALAGGGTRPRLDTGELGIVAARVTTAADVAALAALETVGQSRRFTGLIEWSRPEFEVRSHAAVAVGLDGEALMLDPPLHFRSIPGAVRVRLPRHASGRWPASRTVAPHRDWSSLLRVAAGRVEPGRVEPGPG